MSYWAIPEKDNNSGRGVLVCHAWWGLNDFFKSVCDDLAKVGYVAYAPDLYNGKVAKTIEEAEAAVNAVDHSQAQKILQTAVDDLLSHEAVTATHVGVVGYSMGASWAFWLANERPDALKVAVIYYGMGDSNFQNTRAAFIAHLAENDPYEDSEYIDFIEGTLKSAGLEADFHTYQGTTHWFAESNQPTAYDPKAAQLAWERTLNFLDSHLERA